MISSRFAARFVAIIGVWLLASGCGGAPQNTHFVGNWRIVQMGQVKLPGTAVWSLNSDGTASISGQKSTWTEQDGTLNIVTPRLTYQTTPSLSTDGQKLTLVLPPDFGGGKLSPILLQKAS